MKSVDWAEVCIAIAVGMAIGVCLPFLLHWLGLPGKMVGILVGAFTAPAVAITYQIRMRKQRPPDRKAD